MNRQHCENLPFPLFAKEGNYSSVALVAILALTFYLRLLFFGQMIDADVGNLGYMGWRMAEGEVLIDLEGPGKPPLFAMLYALFVQAFGPSVLGLKMFGAFFVLMAVISIYWLANKAYGKEIGLLAALFFGVFSSGPMVEGGTVNLETLLHLPSILAIGFFMNGSISGQLRWYFLAGLCAAMASLVKQVGGVLFFSFLCSEIHKGWRIKEWLFRYTILGTGALVPVIGLIFFYTLHGYTLFDLYDSMLGSNLKYLQRGYVDASLIYYFFSSMKKIFLENSLLWVGTIFSTLYLGWMIFRGKGKDSDRILLWWAFWSITILWIRGVFYAHYFLQMIAPFSVLAAYGVGITWKLTKKLPSLPKFISRGVWAIILMITTIFFIRTDYKPFFSYNPIEQTVFQYKGLDGIIDEYGYGVYNVVQQGVAAYIRDHTDPKDTIYIWGVAPQVYYLAQRRAATRYRNNYNLSENVTHDPYRALQAFAPIVMEEIRRARPAYVVQMIRLEDFPELQRFIWDHYEIEEIFEIPSSNRKVNLYRRQS